MHTVTLPGHRKRKCASHILRLHAKFTERHMSAKVDFSDLKIVCVSDTHNKQPDIPIGDIFLHAGDLTEWGSFNEIQTQLDWIDSLPHKHKIIIAGNHDVLLDEEYMSRLPDPTSFQWHLPWKPMPKEDREHLNFGSVIYLENSSTVIEVADGKRINVYGCPYTPRSAGNSAFQILRTDAESIWEKRLPQDTDILLTHGPPYGHVDGFPRAGCTALLREIVRVRPGLVVCGHIHSNYGQERLVIDRVRIAYENIALEDSGWDGILMMVMASTWTRLYVHTRLILNRLGFFTERPWSHTTQIVNAAVVSGRENRITNEAIVIDTLSRRR